jgi:hypothetical protein
VSHALIDGSYYADTKFLNSIRIPGVRLESLGFGEFYAETPLGVVEFDRLRGREFPGQSGRSHKVYDRDGGDKATRWLIEKMEGSGNSSLVVAAAAGKVASHVYPEDVVPGRSYLVIMGRGPSFVSTFLRWGVDENGPRMFWEDQDGMEWEAYMHKGYMAGGSGADRITLSRA